MTSKKRNIYIKVEKQEEVVLLTVTNKWVGIDLERFKDKLFQPGSRFHAGIDSGQGKGLYIKKQRVETIAGRVEVDNKVN